MPRTRRDRRSRRRRWPRRIGVIAAVLIVGLAILALLAPTIISAAGRGPLAGAISGAIPGSIAIDDLSLSWLGPQQIGPVRLADPEGDQFTALELRAEVGLLALLTGQRDLGELVLRGDARIVRDQSGQTNLERALRRPARQAQPPSEPTSEPPTLPAGLAAALRLDDVAVSWIDQREGVTADVIFTGDASFSVADGAAVDLEATLPASPAGAARLRLAGNVTDLTDAAGALRPREASVEATLEASELPVALLDSLTGLRGRLGHALGPTVTATARVRGGLDNASADLAVAATTGRVDLAAGFDGQVVALSAPGSIQADVAELMTTWPQLRDALRAGGHVELLTAPTVTISLAQASAKLPEPGAAFALGSIGFDATIRAGEMAARVADLDAGGRPAEITTAPATVLVRASPLADGLHLEADANASVDGRSAGALRLALDAELLEEDGRLRSFQRPGDLEPRGELTIQGFETRIAQPYVEPYRLQLAEDIGPALDLTISASPDGQATDLTLSLQSEHVTADGRARLDGSVVAIGADGARLTLAQPGPLATRLLAGAGVTIDQADSVDLHLSETRVDLEAIARGDLRGAAVVAQLDVGPASGAAPLAEQPQPFQTGPIAATIRADDVAGTVELVLQAAGRLDGHNAGRLQLNASAGDLLDADGRLRLTLPQTLRASGSWKEISTALAQRWAEPAGITLAEDVGPRLDLTFSAAPQAGALGLELNAQARKLGVDAAALWDGAAVRSAEVPVRITLRDVGSTLGRLAPATAPLTVAPGGTVRIELAQFTVPVAGGFKPEAISAAAVLRAENLRATPPGEGEVALSVMEVRYAGQDPAAARLELGGELRHGPHPLTVSGGFDLRSPLLGNAGSWAEAVVAMAPDGELTIANIPPSLIEAFLPAPPPADTASNGAARFDVSELIEQFTEAPATVRLALAPAGDVVNVNCAADGGSTSVAVEGAVGARSLRLGSATADLRLEQGLIAQLLPENRAAITKAAPIRLTAAPVEVALSPAGAVDLASAGELKVSAGTTGQLLITDFTIPGPEGAADRALPPIGVRGLTAEVTTGAAALLASGDVTLRVETDVITSDDHVVARAVLGAAAQTSQGQFTGDPRIDIVLRDLDAIFCDQLAGHDLLVSGATGDRIDAISLEADVRLRGDERPVDLQRLTVSVASPRLRTTEPVRLDRQGGALVLEAPTEVHWRAVPGWTNRFVLQVADDPARTPDYRARFSAPTDLVIDIDKLSLGPPGAWLAPGAFALQARVASDRIAAMTAGGDDVSLTDLRLQVARGDQPGSVTWDLSAQQRGVDTAGQIAVTGRITSLADQRGAPAFDQATLTLHAKAPALRSAVVDSILRQGGLVHAMMGQTMAFEANVEQLSATGGTAAVSAESPLARLAIEGRVSDDSAFIVTGPERLVTLHQITPELGDLLAPGLPQIARFEKRPEDGEAYVTHSNFQFPVDGDVSRLNGQVTITLGAARFQTSSAFSKVLKTVELQDRGSVGRRLGPLTLTMTNGVITYDRYTIPLGEFNMQTSGTIDLPNRSLDVVTWIPIGALTDEAAGMFNTGLGSFLGRAVPEFERLTMVPWRTSGKFGNTTTLPAPALFVENVGSRLLRPDKMIRDIFGDYSKPKDKPAQSPPSGDAGGQQTGGKDGGGG